MVERRKELNQRYQRKKKLAKLKARLAAAKDGRERDKLLTSSDEQRVRDHDECISPLSHHGPEGCFEIGFNMGCQDLQA